MCAFFNAFGGANDELAVVELAIDALEGGAKELGRYDGDDNLRGADCGDVRGDGEIGREWESRKKQRILSRGVDGASFIFTVCPEGEGASRNDFRFR
jgi:hypothetical protein